MCLRHAKEGFFSPGAANDEGDIPFARFLASCSGVKLATPLDPGIVFLFFGSGPFPETGVECWDPWLEADSPVSTSMAGRSLLTEQPRPEDAGDAAVMESLVGMLHPGEALLRRKPLISRS